MPATAVQRPTSFQLRATVSVVVAISFAMLAASGVVLFLAPPGRVANWTNWTILGYTKSQWASLHICFAALFLAGVALHVYFNWRPLISYFKSRVTRRVGFRPEWVIGVLVCAAVFVGTRFSVAPFSLLLAWSEELKQSWETHEQRAPIPHAELLSIGELARQAGVDVDRAVARLAAGGVAVANEGQIVRDVAEAAGISARRVYELITSDLAGRGAGGSDNRARAGAGGHGPAGTDVGGGIGWRTVSEICTSEGVDIDRALRRLRDAGLEATAETTMRDLAAASETMRPYEILELVRSER